jgi:hypothetical protein
MSEHQAYMYSFSSINHSLDASVFTSLNCPALVYVSKLEEVKRCIIQNVVEARASRSLKPPFQLFTLPCIDMLRYSPVVMKHFNNPALISFACMRVASVFCLVTS